MEKDLGSFLEGLKNNVSEYMETRLQLTRVQAYEKIAKVSSVLFSSVILAMLFFFALVFVSVTAGFYFSEITSGYKSGFGIVALIYIVLFAFVIVFRKSLIEKAFTGIIIKELFENYDEDENN